MTSPLNATRIETELRSIERRGALAAVALTTRIKAEILHAIRTGRPMPDVGDMVVDRLTPLMLDAAVVAYGRGFQRSRLIARLPRAPADTTFTLGIFDSALTALGKFFDIDAVKAVLQTDVVEVLRGAGEHVERELRPVVSEVIAAGEHTREGIKAIGAKFDALGMGQQPYRLEAIFRTQTQLTYGAGRWQADQDPDIQDILWGYEYNTVGDDRVRPSHVALDGTRLPKENPFWREYWPPNGYNCRCAALPIFHGEAEAKSKHPPLGEGGRVVRPDPGFAFNPGDVFKVTA
jgi:SPP1 gp7 family putative phage head morphogenesis protein